MRLLGVEFWTTEDVARHLNVSESYIRWLTRQGKLRRHPLLPGKTAYYLASDVRRLRAGSHSPVVTELDPPQRPLELVDEKILEFAPRYGLLSLLVHVRCYAGPGRRVVVYAVTGHYAGHTSLGSHAEQVIEMIHRDLCPDEDPMSIVWIELQPEEFHPALSSLPAENASDSEIINVVIRPDEDQWILDSRRPVADSEFDALLGGADFAWYDWAHYTPETIEEHRRTGAPVEVEHDPSNLRERAEAYQLLQTERETLTDSVVDAAHLGLATQLGLIARMAKHTTQAGDTGSVIHRVPIDTEALFTEAGIPDLDDLPYSGEAFLDALRKVQHGLEQVDSYSQHPDPQLESALLRARSDLIDVSNVTAGFDETHWVAAADHVPEVLRLDEHLVWSRRYFDSIIWNDHQRPENRQERILEDKTPRAGVVRFGQDPFGNAVAEFRWAPSRPTELCVLWPTKQPTTEPLPAGIQLVADPTGADTPAFLAKGGEIIDLLPKQRLPHNGWSYGYPGGGPEALAQNADAYVTARGRSSRKPAFSRAIERPDEPNRPLEINIDLL